MVATHANNTNPNYETETPFQYHEANNDYIFAYKYTSISHTFASRNHNIAILYPNLNYLLKSHITGRYYFNYKCIQLYCN